MQIFQVLIKTQKLLAFDPSVPTNPAMRMMCYSVSTPPKLSTLKGKALCAEYAALGQFLLQKVGVSSSYMSGVSMIDPNEDDLENHSFLILSGDEKLVFDIARPISEHNLPRLLWPVVPFTYDLLKEEKNLLVAAKDVLRSKKVLYYGVGNPMETERSRVITGE